MDPLGGSVLCLILEVCRTNNSSKSVQAIAPLDLHKRYVDHIKLSILSPDLFGDVGVSRYGQRSGFSRFALRLFFFAAAAKTDPECSRCNQRRHESFGGSNASGPFGPYRRQRALTAPARCSPPQPRARARGPRATWLCSRWRR